MRSFEHRKRAASDADLDEPGRHTCHWPGCRTEVPPKRWGCGRHWFALPKPIRDAIWAAYRPGQEITKTPSEEYLKVAREANEWAMARERELRTAKEAQSRQEALF